MSGNIERPVPAWAQMLIWALLAVFTIFQLVTMFGPNGWVTLHGYAGGNALYLKLSLSDPVMFAGMIDILACVLVALILLANAIPRGRGYIPLLLIAAVLTISYPGFGLLLFLALYWRRLGQFRV